MIGFALCGSFCTHSKSLEQMNKLTLAGYEILPIVSENVYTTDTRFGTSAELMEKIKVMLSAVCLFGLESLLGEEIKAMGVKVAFVTLHVGLGTFRPVKEEKVEDHIMHYEYYTITKETCDVINSTKQSGGRVIAVGTTSCRVLESVGKEDGSINEQSGWTGIFIYPGYKFKIVDSLITNFHLPESTLLMLVSSLAGRENILNAYEEAIKEKYRFFSFGDAMLIK